VLTNKHKIRIVWK